LIISALIFNEGIKSLAQKKYALMVAKVLLVVLILSTLLSTHAFKNKRTKTDWRGVSQHIKQNYSKEHLIVFKAFTDEENWDPGYYGLNRYSIASGEISWMAMKNLEKRLTEIISLPLKPVVVFFQYRDYYLTDKSTYPFMASSIAKPELDMEVILTSNKLDIKKYTGLSIISLKESSGHLVMDTMILFNELLRHLPQQSSLGDMYRVFAMTLAMCGEKNYLMVLKIAEQLNDKYKLSQGQREKIDNMYFNAESRNYSCLIE